MTTFEAEITRLNITRLCHLTPVINLVHILAGAGLRSSQDLGADERAYFDPQDLLRVDGHPDHISCSIEYPNAWYLRHRRSDATPEQRLAPDWVCILIDPKWLAHPETRFCVNNAARFRGALISQGIDAFRQMYGSPIDTAREPLIRSSSRLHCCPTDDQAEVLVPRGVPLADIQGIVCATEEQARRVYWGLRQNSAVIDHLSFTIAPDIFNATRLSALIHAGARPAETEFAGMPDG